MARSAQFRRPSRNPHRTYPGRWAAIPQTVSPDGIPSAEALGAPQVNLTISPNGISTAESLGSPVVAGPVFADGISSAESVGSPQVNLTIYPDTIASAESVGSPTVNLVQALFPDGINSAESLGSPQVNLTIFPGGISSAESVGSPQVNLTVFPGGISSAESVGAPQVNLTVFPGGISTAETLGAPQVNLTIFPGGVSSAESVGSPTVTVAGGGLTVNPNGIGSAETVGNPQVNLTISPDGIPAPGIVGSNVFGNSDYFDFDTNTISGWSSSGTKSWDSSGFFRTTVTGGLFPFVQSHNIDHGDFPCPAGPVQVEISFRASRATEYYFDIYNDGTLLFNTFTVPDSGWHTYTFDMTFTGTIVTAAEVGFNVAGATVGDTFDIDYIKVSPTGQALGAPTVTSVVTVSPGGISTAESLGAPTVTQQVVVSPNGISSAEALGAPTVIAGPFIQITQDIYPPSLIGDVTVTTRQVVTLESVSSRDAIAAPTVTKQVFLVSTPDPVLEPPAALEDHLVKVDIPRAVTWYRIGATWYQTRELFSDDYGADEYYVGGYEYEVDAATAAELQGAGLTLRTEFR